MFFPYEPDLATGTTVLVTGVSGFVGSHIADHLISAGYNVRGTTRDATRTSWIASLFERKYGLNRFQLCPVSNTGEANTFAEVLQGVSAIVHTASDMTYGSDPNQVITPTVAMALNLLRSAAQNPSIKRFVYTSSCAAAATPKQGVWPRISSETWNEEAIQEAWAPPPYLADRAFAVYAASKAQAERELWKWYEENKPGFVLNTVLPSMNLGESLDPVNQGHPSTSGLIEALFKGNHEPVNGAHQYFYVDVKDTARLHLAALLHPDIHNERIFAYAGPYTWHMIQTAMKSIYPEKEFSPDITEAEVDQSEIVLAPKAEGYLREMGYKGWTTLEESVKMNTLDLV
ncbi:aldehyde reductase [Fusarium beomiforme]|uniref:Aldehyde reductase n=1 Tax=Fusarium beomiforme TaxID=44412 RepID=A0A9P5DM59_9HYPO|nr:aldehyde reductase [Fusarium beomiforme]